MKVYYIMTISIIKGLILLSNFDFSYSYFSEGMNVR